MRSSQISCDYCTETIDLHDDEYSVDRGWYDVAFYDTIREEVEHLDFCCEECLINHFR